MSADSNVKEITTADSQAEYESFLAENQANTELLTTLEDEAMRQLMLDTMQATMRIKVHDPSNLDSIRQIVKQDQLFQANLDDEKAPTYDVNQTEIETINSWASIAKNKNIPIAVISESMGHDSEKTTRIYLAALDKTSIDDANNLILNDL